MFASQEQIIIALTKGAGSARFITDDADVPQGCGTETVTADINVHIPVQGKVDAQAEVEKLEKKVALSQANKEKVVKLTKQSNYETAVKAEVRAANDDKLEKLDAEIEALTQAMERFKTLL